MYLMITVLHGKLDLSGFDFEKYFYVPPPPALLSIWGP